VKKLLTVLALLLTLCVLCGVALAEGHPVDEETGAYIHNYNVSEDASKVITWPTATKDGLIRFVCEYAGEDEYEDPENEGYLPEAQDFQEYVVYAYDGEFPDTLEEALKLAAEDPDRVDEKKSKDATCTKPGVLVIKSGWYSETAFEKLEYVDEVWFRGWKGKDTRTKSYEVPAGHKWSDDEQWADLRKEMDKPQYHFIKEATCTEEGILRPYCLVCDEERGDEVYTDPIDHTKAWVVVVPATCKTEGKEEYRCTMCGELFEDENGESEHVLPVDAKAHVFGDWVTDSEVKPTCVKDGSLTQHRICKVCLDAKEVNTTVLEALGHVNKKNAKKNEVNTCVEHYIQYLCTRCGEEIARDELDVDPKAHPEQFWKKTESKDPTCTEDGYEKYVCDLCGQEGERVLSMLGHDLDLETEKFIPGKCAKEEADEVADSYEYLCKRCGEIVTIEGAIPEHVWSKWTCRNEYNQGGLDTPAYWIRQCLICGKHQEEKRNDNLDMNNDCDMNGHTIDEAKTVTVAATCTAEGKVTYTCAVCGKTWDEVLPLAAHTVVADEAVAATCAVPGKSAGSHCSVCGKVLVAQEEVPATGHTYVKAEAVAPTCTVAGKTARVYCSVCGDVLVEANEVPALGHTAKVVEGKAATCTEDGLTDGEVCSVCGETIKAQEVIKAEGHKSDEGTVTKEATATEKGVKEYKCTVCGEVIKTEEVEFDYKPASYTLEDLSIENGKISAKIAHDPESETVQIYARITVYTEDQTFFSMLLPVSDEINSFVSGNWWIVTIELTADNSVVPGEYTAMDSDFIER